MFLACVFAAMLLFAGCGKPPAPAVEVQFISFTAEFYDAVDKWVAFRGKDSTNIAGFVYIDPHEGFLFNYETTFIITETGLKKHSGRLDSASDLPKIRLGGNTANVAILSDKDIEQLGLPKIPDWLKQFKPENEDESSYLVSVGYSYNHIGASHKAIEPLQKVYDKDPHFRKVEFELAYAYNATKNFDKAIEISNKAIAYDSTDYLLYKELGFSLIHQDKLEEAEKVYLKGIEVSKTKEMQAEMAHNMAYSYFLVKNKPKFKEWAELTKKYAEEDSKFLRNIKYFEKNWDK
ncbi:MAG: hypothetical protein FWC26_03675 [Fibromonadales bacterium]|nr:hypothetical protein [Fibromonadales bacterium]